MTPHEFTLFLYNATLLPIIFFSVLFLVLSLLNILLRKEKKQEKELVFDELPFVSVQIPTFNDPIAARCVQHCLQFNYPKDKYEIIIADDSTNKETQALLKQFETDNPGSVKYFHRDNRIGYKAGALKEVMPFTRGEIFVIFDSDWMPQRDFLDHVVQPFVDEQVAIVQTRQGVYNKDQNLITRFAAYVLMIYHTIIMPINNKINCVFFCGTAGAIRRSAFEKVGGWNLHSITEDSDLTVRLLMEGYKSKYLDIETPSEVPETLEGFVKQQMRWCYGNTRVFFDNALSILFKKGLGTRRRLMILYVTLGNFIAPVVVGMTFFGFAGWFIGEPTLFTLADAAELFVRFSITAGFIVIGLLTLYKRSLLREFPHLLASLFTMGLVLAVANSVAFIKAAFNKHLSWYCTPKAQNVKFA